MCMEQVNEILYRTGVIPVIQLDTVEQAVPLAQALLEGGIQAAEVTFRTSAAAGAIAAMSKAFPTLFVCAGTILTVEQAKLAQDCGAKAIISPGTNSEVVRWCLDQQLPVYPGCATPTEVEAALALGLSAVKLFPAEVVGGVKLLKALYGPYRQMLFMPTGGISPGNVTEYLLQPNVIACGGSWLCPADALAAGDYSTIRRLSEETAALVQKIRA